MRVLLWDGRKGLYYRATDTWTVEVSDAEDFGTSLRAAYYAQQRGLGGVEVLLDFGDAEYNVYLRVPESENGSAVHEDSAWPAETTPTAQTAG